MTKEERDDRRRNMFSLIRKFQGSHMSARDFYRQHQLVLTPNKLDKILFILHHPLYILPNAYSYF